MVRRWTEKRNVVQKCQEMSGKAQIKKIKGDNREKKGGEKEEGDRDRNKMRSKRKRNHIESSIILRNFPGDL
jgi:hypothetical protein